MSKKSDDFLETEKRGFSLETKTTEQISEDYEYEIAYANTLRDINLMGETKWVRVDDIKELARDYVKMIDNDKTIKARDKLLASGFIVKLFNELSQSNPNDSDKLQKDKRLKTRLDESEGNKSEKTPISNRSDESTSLSLSLGEQSSKVDNSNRRDTFNPKSNKCVNCLIKDKRTDLPHSNFCCQRCNDEWYSQKRDTLIHHTGNVYGYYMCGLRHYAGRFDKRDWSLVTCKDCLKFKVVVK